MTCPHKKLPLTPKIPLSKRPGACNTAASPFAFPNGTSLFFHCPLRIPEIDPWPPCSSRTSALFPATSPRSRRFAAGLFRMSFRRPAGSTGLHPTSRSTCHRKTSSRTVRSRPHWSPGCGRSPPLVASISSQVRRESLPRRAICRSSPTSWPCPTTPSKRAGCAAGAGRLPCGGSARVVAHRCPAGRRAVHDPPLGTVGLRGGRCRRQHLPLHCVRLHVRDCSQPQRGRPIHLRPRRAYLT